MYKKLAIQKNKIIKYFLFLNIVFYILIFILPKFSWLNEIIVLCFIIFFVFEYLISRKEITGHIEHNINMATKEESLSLFEVYAGTIIGQIIVLIIVFSFRLIFLSVWIKLLLYLPLVPIAIIFEEEYKKNKKLIKNN